jgi:hypothetical protein
MIPIYEQGSGKGIGHGLDTFLARFDAICEDHMEMRRARAFAFIFYDFSDGSIRRILKNQGVFTTLDRLAGTDLSIFYLHAGTRQAVKQFNRTFLARLNVEEMATPPCVVFFRLHEGQIDDIEITELDSTDLIHSFKELYDVIADYCQNRIVKKPSSTLKWIKKGAAFVSVEAFRAALKHLF